MDYQGKVCCLTPFSTANTVVKAKFDTSEITNLFQETLNSQLQKKGLTLQQEEMGAQILIRGKIVNVDEGNRWLRYFLTFLGGKTVFEAEGEIVIDGVPSGELHSMKKSGIGVFGGSPQGLLKANAKSAAKDITSQVFKTFKTSP
jgi:hypothetical protein